MEALQTAALGYITANATTALSIFTGGLAVLGIFIGAALIWKATRQGSKG